jgi:hypothetical protein
MAGLLGVIPGLAGKVTGAVGKVLPGPGDIASSIFNPVKKFFVDLWNDYKILIQFALFNIIIGLLLYALVRQNILDKLSGDKMGQILNTQKLSLAAQGIQPPHDVTFLWFIIAILLLLGAEVWFLYKINENPKTKPLIPFQVPSLQ